MKARKHEHKIELYGTTYKHSSLSNPKITRRWNVTLRVGTFGPKKNAQLAYMTVEKNGVRMIFSKKALEKLEAFGEDAYNSDYFNIEVEPGDVFSVKTFAMESDELLESFAFNVYDLGFMLDKGTETVVTKDVNVREVWQQPPTKR